MQADEEDLQRTRGAQFGGALAEQLDQFVMDDLDDQLPGRDRCQHLLTDGLGLHALDELARDTEMDVGCEQGGPHLLQGLRHVVLGEPADAAQVAQGLTQTFRERFEHGSAQ